MRSEGEVTLLKHLSNRSELLREGIHYTFFRGSSNFFNIPGASNSFVKQQRPDLVLIQGFIFPIQVASLRLSLGKRPKILVQHRADVPFRRKKIFQQFADRFIDGYLFTSKDMAQEWIDARVIKDLSKCFELPSSTTEFVVKDKMERRRATGLTGSPAFLWVGRLNENKDPLTVLEAFDQYAATNPAAMLYMIYQEDDLLPVIEKFIDERARLQVQVKLVGKVAHEALNNWYAAADYFIHASHREGGSFALVEAMACGCVPIHTGISSSLSLSGDKGFSFKPGDVTALASILVSLDKNKYAEQSAGCVQYFNEALSAPAIAKKLMEIYRGLPGK